MNNENISVKEAAEILDKDPQFIRIGLQRDRLPFGSAVLNKSKWNYHISKKALEKYMEYGKMIIIENLKGVITNEKV